MKKVNPYYHTYKVLMICFALLYNVSLSAQKQPNILFAISDDQSFAHTSYAGCSFVKTPAFDRIAKEGVYFPKAYAASPGCAPSRSAIVTGRYPWQNEQAGQHASWWPKKYISFVDLLKNAGYLVGRTGKGVDPFKFADSENDSLRMDNPAGPVTAKINYDSKDDRSAYGISSINYAEEFKAFVSKNKTSEKPFFFWYGAREPHRGYELDSWKRNNKSLKNAKVPKFLPDNDLVKGDLLDYAVEIEWFDSHLDRMVSYLKKIGEYDNTIIIVTSDNGMPFPRTKANCYEYGIHVPLAIKFPKNSNLNKMEYRGNVSLAQLAPTVLELTNVSSKGMLPISNSSLVSQLEGKVSRVPVFSSRERHSSSRYKNWGYPQRAVIEGDYLLIWNVKPNRWPAGAPQRYDKKDGTLLNRYSLDENGKYTQGTIFADVDDSPSKTFLIENYSNPSIVPFFDFSFDYRPEFELYNVKEDPDCIDNLYEDKEHIEISKQLHEQLVNELKQTKDARVGDENPENFDEYPRYSKMRYFPKPK
ncbi:sulfatase family protein [Galbibacter mesophilus]|uniref:sulfatase family protein n=1 Tax=Galbibacter mesophilus TaxID=379069 RepID=UPI00191D0A25|nr:sulfatase [Galbibacter mesophilus]MCM5664048.1 sulfatase [Galbibacter mesophilus]